MPVVFPVSMPSSTKPRMLEYGPIFKHAVVESEFDFTAQFLQGAGERWEFAAQYAALTPTQGLEWLTFQLQIARAPGTFLFAPRTAPRGVVTGTIQVNGGSQTGYSLAMDGFALSTNGVFLPGDFISLAESGSLHPYLHMVTTQVNSDGAGQGTAEIWPALRYSPSDNRPVNFNGAQGVFRLKNPLVLRRGPAEIFEPFSIEMVEVVSPVSS